MASAGDAGRSERIGPSEHARFVLERFAWGAPERLEVVGSFAGLHDAPTADPELVVHGGGQSHRLPVVPESRPEPPVDGRRWRADFAWTVPPVPFESADLVFGDDMLVALPIPGSRRPLSRKETLEVRRLRPPPVDSLPGGDENSAHDKPDGGAGTLWLRQQTELIAAREEVRELRAAVERGAQAEVRAREDLEAERQRHAGDSERFREQLESVRTAAEEALAVERNAALKLTADLREAHESLEARDAEKEALRERVSALEATRAQRELARSAADEALAEAGRLIEHLETVREALGKE
jgi:hypothetical protein